MRKLVFSLACRAIGWAVNRSHMECALIFMYGQSIFDFVSSECKKSGIKLEDAFVQNQTKVLSRQEVAAKISQILDNNNGDLESMLDENLPIC